MLRGSSQEHADFTTIIFYTDPILSGSHGLLRQIGGKTNPGSMVSFAIQIDRDLAKVMKDNEGREPWWLVPTRLGIKWPVGYLYQKERMEKAGLWTRLDELVETSNKKAQSIGR